MTYDDLFQYANGPWLEDVSDECRVFLEELADDMAKRGKNPVWARVRRRIAEEFPDDAPRTIDPIQRALRELVDTRG